MGTPNVFVIFEPTITISVANKHKKLVKFCIFVWETRKTFTNYMKNKNIVLFKIKQKNENPLKMKKNYEIKPGRAMTKTYV